MSYDYQSALDQNVSPETIANFLGKQQNFDVEGAVKAGADIKDVMVFLSNKAQQDPSTNAPVAPEAPQSTTSVASSVVTPSVTGNPTFKETGQEGLIGGIAKTVGNVPSSVVGLGKSLFSIVNHPIDTLKGIKDTLMGLGEGAGKLIMEHTGLGQKVLEKANEFRQATGQPLLPVDEKTGKISMSAITPPELEKINQIGEALKQRYGSLENLKKTVIEDPAGVAFDVASLLTGGEGLLAKGAKVAELGGLAKTATTLAKGAELAGKGAELVNPLTQVPKYTMKAVNGVKSAVVPATVAENVSKVLTNTGKKTLGEVASNKAVESATNAFETIRQNAPNITVKDINGIEKKFEPAKANFFELPQALKQTKDAIYAEYSNIAKKAGDAGLELGKKDFEELNSTLEKYQGKGYTPAFSDKAKQFQEALNRFDGKATPEEIQSLIEQVNLDVNPTGTKAGNQVANDFSQALRNKLDSKLEKSGNPAYQATRDKYAQLKSIEGDVINRFKKSLREAGAKPDLIDHISSMDSLYGVLSGNGVHTALGLGTKIARATYQKFFSAEASLKRTFQGLEEQATKTKTLAEEGIKAKAQAKLDQVEKLKAEAPKGMFNESNPEIVDIADNYSKANKIPVKKPEFVYNVDKKQTADIAQAFEDMKNDPTNPKVKKAYQEFADETIAQYKELEQAGYKFEPWEKEGQPYATPKEMMDDVKNNKHIYYFKTEKGFGGTEGNPLLKPSGIIINGENAPINDIFRGVHDVFGHAQFGNKFDDVGGKLGDVGEENAWRIHSAMFTPNARRAMTTETRGQNSWINNNFDKTKEVTYPENKIGLLPDKYVFPEKVSAESKSKPLSPVKGRAKGTLQKELNKRKKEAGV